MECNHIIGYEYGVDESWLCRASAGFQNTHMPEFGIDPDIHFSFCPLCGEKLATPATGELVIIAPSAY